MDGETVYEALWELKCNGPHKWDALQLLESEVLTATMLRPSEKIASRPCKSPRTRMNASDLG